MTTTPVSDVITPATDAEIELILDAVKTYQNKGGHLVVLATDVRSLIARIRSEREQAVRECAEIVWNLPANTGEYVRRHDADAAIKSLLPKPLSLSQVSAKK